MSASPRNIDDAGSSADLPVASQHGNGPSNTETSENIHPVQPFSGLWAEWGCWNMTRGEALRD